MSSSNTLLRIDFDKDCYPVLNTGLNCKARNLWGSPGSCSLYLWLAGSQNTDKLNVDYRIRREFCLWVEPAVRCPVNLDMCLPLLLLLPLLSRADQFYPAPTDQSEGTFTEWWSEFSLWRDETRDTLNLSLYSAPGLQWAATSFIQPQVEYFITGLKILRHLRSSKNVTFRLCCMIGSCMTVSLANGLFHVSLKISRPGGLKLSN